MCESTGTSEDLVCNSTDIRVACVWLTQISMILEQILEFPPDSILQYVKERPTTTLTAISFDIAPIQVKPTSLHITSKARIGGAVAVE